MTNRCLSPSGYSGQFLRDRVLEIEYKAQAFLKSLLHLQPHFFPKKYTSLLTTVYKPNLSITLRTRADLRGGSDLSPCQALPLALISSSEWPGKEALFLKTLILPTDFFGTFLSFAPDPASVHSASQMEKQGWGPEYLDQSHPACKSQ